MRTSARCGTMAAMTVAGYLADLDATLVGPRRVRRDLVREAGDHLEDATDAYVRAGYGRPDAERRAVADFGTLEEIAPAFQTTLAVAASRRTARLLLAILCVQPFLWDGPLATGDAVPPGGWLYPLLDVGVEVLGAGTMVAAVLLVVASGLGNRWFRAGRRLARLTSYVALLAAGFVVLTGVTMTALSQPRSLLAWLMLSVFILVPMSATGLSARRTFAASG